MNEQPDVPDRGPERDAHTGRSAAAQRIQNQTQWVELQLLQAQERGEFDDLPGFGKPLTNLGSDPDPDWWLKQLIAREHVTGVLPPALQLRKDDAELDALLDRRSTEVDIRREVEDFNERVRKALYQPLGGPPLITQQRDVETELERWRERREARRAAQQPAEAEPQSGRPAGRRQGRWRHRSR
jgi:hypothetical protein